MARAWFIIAVWFICVAQTIAAQASVRPRAIERIPNHLVTFDYIPGGTKFPQFTGSVENIGGQLASIAKFVSVAETSKYRVAETRAIGVRVELYQDWIFADPSQDFWNGHGTGKYAPDAFPPENEFAHSCNGARLTHLYGGTLRQYLMEPDDGATPAGSSIHPRPGTLLGDVIDGLKRIRDPRINRYALGVRPDQVFADDAIPPQAFDGIPCGYTDQGWIKRIASGFRALPFPIVYNGAGVILRTSKGFIPLYQSMDGVPNVIGGTIEGCFDQNSKPFVPYVTLSPEMLSTGDWLSHEDTILHFAREHKILRCFGKSNVSADQALDVRFYDLASLLLAYDPRSTQVYESMRTTSGMHVEPEMGLVALSPVKEIRSNFSELQVPRTRVFAREYRRCFYWGSSIGPCAAVVNPDPSHDYPVPKFSVAFHHMMGCSGAGMLRDSGISLGALAHGTPLPTDNGTCNFTAAPPALLSAPRGETQGAGPTGLQGYQHSAVILTR